MAIRISQPMRQLLTHFHDNEQKEAVRGRTGRLNDEMARKSAGVTYVALFNRGLIEEHENGPGFIEVRLTEAGRQELNQA